MMRKRINYKKKKELTILVQCWHKLLYICNFSWLPFILAGVLVQHGIKVTCEKTGNFKSTLQKSYRSVAFLLNNCKLPNDEVGTREFSHVTNFMLTTKYQSFLVESFPMKTFLYWSRTLFFMLTTKHHTLIL
jgi:hypothetical protein